LVLPPVKMFSSGFMPLFFPPCSRLWSSGARDFFGVSFFLRKRKRCFVSVPLAVFALFRPDAPRFSFKFYPFCRSKELVRLFDLSPRFVFFERFRTSSVTTPFTLPTTCAPLVPPRPLPVSLWLILSAPVTLRVYDTSAPKYRASNNPWFPFTHTRKFPSPFFRRFLD